MFDRASGPRGTRWTWPHLATHFRPSKVLPAIVQASFPAFQADLTVQIDLLTTFQADLTVQTDLLTAFQADLSVQDDLPATLQADLSVQNDLLATFQADLSVQGPHSDQICVRFS